MIITTLALVLILFGRFATGQCGDTTQVIQLELFKPTYIESPNIANQNYAENLTCSWLFNSSSDSNGLLVYVQYFGLSKSKTNDYFKGYEGTDETGTIFLDSTEHTTANRTLSRKVLQNTIFVLFNTDEISENNGQGFFLYVIDGKDVSGLPCGGETNVTVEMFPKYISSPNFPNSYPINCETVWNIVADEQSQVLVSIQYLDVEPNTATSCYDTITIADLDPLCSDNMYYIDGFNIRVNGSFTIRFKSDAHGNQHKGFVLSYKALTIDMDSTESLPDETTSGIPFTKDMSTSKPERTSSLTTSKEVLTTYQIPETSQSAHTTSFLQDTTSQSTQTTSQSIQTTSNSVQTTSMLLDTIITSSQSAYMTTQSKETQSQPVETSSQSAQTTKQSQEITSQSAQTTKQSQETTSQSQETTSQSAQTTKQSQETTSQSAQTTKQSQETTSQSAQTTNQSQETTSQSAQTTNQSQETTSQSAQTTKQSKETTSQSAQTTKQSQETTSQSAQTTKQSQETTSQSVLPTFQTTTESIVGITQQDTTSSVLVTTQLEYKPLSNAAVGGIITGAIVGVATLGVILGIITAIIVMYSGRSSAVKKPVSYQIPENNPNKKETTFMNSRQRERAPNWIKMLDKIQNKSYNPTFHNQN